MITIVVACYIPPNLFMLYATNGGPRFLIFGGTGRGRAVIGKLRYFHKNVVTNFELIRQHLDQRYFPAKDFFNTVLRFPVLTF